MKDRDKLRRAVTRAVEELETLVDAGSPVPPKQRPTLKRGAVLLVQLLAKLEEQEKHEDRDTG